MANETGAHVWSIEQVVAYAGSSSRFGAGEALALPPAWSRTGASDRGVWGRYHGSGAEPYEVAVDHANVGDRCTCPSRARPCKHAIGLLVLWVRGHVVTSTEPSPIGRWIDRHERHLAASDHPADEGAARERDRPSPTSDPQPVRDPSRNERIERLVGGLVELDRWLEDRLRAGLGDPSIARYATWDDLAKRLTDARAGALANRIRRLAGKVGAGSDWHEQVLAELGILHLLAQAGRRVPQLPADLGDAVAVACGWQVRRADVEVAAPETDRWLVAGRSDTREDLVEVRRVWLRGASTGRWAMALSFAAYRQSLDTALTPGSMVDGDVHRYPGSAQRVLIGAAELVHDQPADAVAAARAAATPVAGAFEQVGGALAAEPWLDRVPALVTARPGRSDHGWVLTDDTGSLAIDPNTSRGDAVGTLLAASAGDELTVTVEWTTDGFVPLTVFLDDRAIDIGPRADPTFVSAA